MAFGNQGGGGFRSLPNLGRTQGAKGGGNRFRGGQRNITRGLPSANLPPPPAATTGAGADAGAGAGSTGSPPTGGSPLDSTYYGNVATNTFNVNNKIAALANQLAQARTTLGTPQDTQLGTTYGNINFAAPRAMLAAEERANAGGGLFSSVEGQQQGDLAQNYANQRATAGRNFQTLQDQIVAQIGSPGVQGSLQQGEGLYNTAQAAAAAVRAANLAAANPALGQTAPSTTVARTPPRGAPKGAKWAGPNKPAGYRGIGGGWWAPIKGGK